ncbi:hypothetical protein [Bacillus sp. EAC]|uniref:hypothetical protein n=1 Tax=Bacillus sp. EAC TaxID=1978338 RepID=UPI000B44F2F5|nr:hypothetical protein [Bacillus sp. EAC]
MKKKKLSLWMILTVTSVFILSGCWLQQQNKNVIIEKNNKKITVLTGKEDVVTNELALKNIVRYEGIQGTDWLNKDTILVEQKNTELPKTAMTFNGQYTYHINLYSFDLNTKVSKIISGEENGQIGPIVSPDKKHIFYKQSSDGTTGTGYIIDLMNEKKIKVSDVDKLFAFSTEGRWLNNKEINYQTIDHQIYNANLNGKITKVNPNSDIEYSLKKKFGGSNVEWVIPSPNQKKFAIVRKISQTKRELFITDAKGRKTTTLAKGTQIFGLSWSPNSKKVAFPIVFTGKGERGLFMVDVDSKKITQLSTDLDEISGPISWSPTGKKLLVTKVKVMNNKNNFVTYILTIKK